uniref:Uncharacterized protein n=1 Tax=Strombidium inclinatum TaxID=197538 RepID=A0A7S3MX35_9SPIT|mmetsp:Transcript_16852/g.25943  ORF Transcript_16852/g.25943 Transcript_16852/m.25943 type:complete len:148 (+) Transcript_16852:3601-4044(+)
MSPRAAGTSSTPILPKPVSSPTFERKHKLAKQPTREDIRAFVQGPPASKNMEKLLSGAGVRKETKPEAKEVKPSIKEAIFGTLKEPRKEEPAEKTAETIPEHHDDSKHIEVEETPKRQRVEQSLLVDVLEEEGLPTTPHGQRKQTQE